MMGQNYQSSSGYSSCISEDINRYEIRFSILLVVSMIFFHVHPENWEDVQFDFFFQVG